MPQQQGSISFVKGDKVGSETDWRDALPVNMYAVAKPIFGENGYLVQNYGVSLLNTTSGGKCRGAFYNDKQDKHFRVQGNDFLEIDTDGVETILGAVTGYIDDQNQFPYLLNPPVTLDYSFRTQAVLANKRFYLYDSVGGFREVLAVSNLNPIDFCWIDGYYFFTDGENLFHTLITDEEVVEPTDFGVAQFSPDAAIGVEQTEDNKVIVFSRFSIEYFYNDGTSDFAFSRVQGRALKVGCVATHLKTELNSKYYMVGGGRAESLGVHVVSGGGSQKVSTREIDKILKKYQEADLENAHMESYTIDGNSFVKIHLPDDTLLFNETAANAFSLFGAWTVLSSGTQGEPDRSTYPVLDTRISEWVVGDLLDGSIGIMDDTVATQYEQIAEWSLFSPFITIEKGSVDEFEIETIPGFTTSNDAKVFISISYDGITYGAQDIVEYGMQNDYGRRFIARRLGYIRDKFSLRLKGASRSRMAFAKGTITYG
jgi:hypothetical protein